MVKSEKGVSVAVVVTHHWANLEGVRLFLRQNQSPSEEIRGTDDSHVVLAKVLDSDERFLWIEIIREKTVTDPITHRFSLSIPWHEILTVVVAEKFSPEIWEQARNMGFTVESRDAETESK